MSHSFDQLETPFVAIDLHVVENNIKTMQDRAAERRLTVRPHTKTHKQPFLARKQFNRGATSLTVAKLDEAEVMLQAGFSDLLIAYPLVGAAKAYRLATLMVRGLRPTVSIDSLVSMRTLSQAAALAQRPINVLVEVDTGFHRCGLTGSAVIELADAIHNEPGLTFQGLMSFAGHIAGNTDRAVIRRIIRDEDEQMAQYRKNLESRHLAVETVSVGGTILSHNMDVIEHATEIRPGIYIFNDMGIVYSGSVKIEQCAARIWATVVSQPAENRAVLDAGSKMLSTDGPLKGAYGYVVGFPGWTIARLSEEHAVVEIAPEAPRPEIGDRVSIIPNHICTVMNLQNNVVGVENGQVTAILPIMSRGGTH
jgi:D-serine deaminase-like pyridoxal phosphate-dependent protein